MIETTQLRNFNNSWYNPGGGAFKRIFWHLVNYWILNSWIPSSGLRVKLLRLFGAKIGKGVVIKPYVSVKYPWKLEVGDYTWIGEHVWIDNLAEVCIGNNVCISQGAFLLTGNHNYKKTTFDLMIGSIKLEEGSWVGAKTTVCPGVTMHSHAILTVGSVLTRHAEEYAIYQGNPAVKVKDRVFN